MKTEFILKGISSCKSFNLENHDSDNLQGLINKATHPANLFDFPQSLPKGTLLC